MCCFTIESRASKLDLYLESISTRGPSLIVQTLSVIHLSKVSERVLSVHMLACYCVCHVLVCVSRVVVCVSRVVVCVSRVVVAVTC